jgi:hypothetical protein
VIQVYVAAWHDPEVLPRHADVRYRESTGKHVLTPSVIAFVPKRDVSIGRARSPWHQQIALRSYPFDAAGGTCGHSWRGMRALVMALRR